MGSPPAPVPELNDDHPWRIGICASGGELSGMGFLIRRAVQGAYLVELEFPAPVPGGLPDDLFVLHPDSEPMREILSELQPVWLPEGIASERAYNLHFPDGPPTNRL